MNMTDLNQEEMLHNNKEHTTATTTEDNGVRANEARTPDRKSCMSGKMLTNIALGPGCQEFNDLSCINAVYLIFLFSFLSTTTLLYTAPIRHITEHECNKNGGKNGSHYCFVSAENITLRLRFAISTTFFALSVLSFDAGPDGLRSKIHQGFWIEKFALVFMLSVTSLLIPVGSFDYIWSIISFIGTQVFHVVQAVFILDLATSITDVFVLKMTTERGSTLWYFIWLVSVWSIYSMVFLLTVLLYMVFIDINCALSLVLLTTVLTFSILYTIITLYFSQHSLLHSGFIIIYVYFLMVSILHREHVCLGFNADTFLSNIVSALDICLGYLVVMFIALRGYDRGHYHYGNRMISRQARAEQLNDEERAEESLVATRKFSSSLFFMVLACFSLLMTSTLTGLKTSQDSEPVLNDLTTVSTPSLVILIIFMIAIWSQVAPIVYNETSMDSLDILTLVRTFAMSFLKLSKRALIEGIPLLNGPIASRWIFTALFLSGLLFSCLLYAPSVRHSLAVTHYFCPSLSPKLGICLTTDPAYMAVYRVCFAMATFYLLFAVILVNTESACDQRESTCDPRESTSDPRESTSDPRESTSDPRESTSDPRESTSNHACDLHESTRDPREDLQYKAWPVKFSLFFSLLFASFFLPNEFSKTWTYLALAGTFLFTIIQLILLLYWANNTSKRLNEKVDSSQTASFWTLMPVIVTFILLTLSLSAVVLFYIYFTRLPLCRTNTIFITMNVFLAIVAALVSVHPKVYDAGLFKCSVIIVFSLYLTWSGLSHNPREECNPFAGYIAEVDMRPNLNVQAGIDLFITVLTVVYFGHEVTAISEYLRRLYGQIRRQESQDHAVACITTTNSSDTKCNSSYNFSLFHLVFFLASLHATIILTNWFIPTQGSRFKLSVNWAAMCVKMTTSSLSLVIYIWCNTAQLLFTQPKS